MAACQSGSVATVSEVLKLMPQLDRRQRDRSGATALHCACEGGQMRAVELLCHRGWDANAIDQQGATALLVGAKRGQSSIVKILLKAGADPRHADAMGRTALHWACLGGQFKAGLH